MHTLRQIKTHTHRTWPWSRETCCSLYTCVYLLIVYMRIPMYVFSSHCIHAYPYVCVLIVYMRIPHCIRAYPYVCVLIVYMRIPTTQQSKKETYIHIEMRTHTYKCTHTHTRT